MAERRRSGSRGSRRTLASHIQPSDRVNRTAAWVGAQFGTFQLTRGEGNFGQVPFQRQHAGRPWQGPNGVRPRYHNYLPMLHALRERKVRREDTRDAMAGISRDHPHTLDLPERLNRAILESVRRIADTSTVVYGSDPQTGEPLPTHRRHQSTILSIYRAPERPAPTSETQPPILQLHLIRRVEGLGPLPTPVSSQDIDLSASSQDLSGQDQSEQEDDNELRTMAESKGQEPIP